MDIAHEFFRALLYLSTTKIINDIPFAASQIKYNTVGDNLHKQINSFIYKKKEYRDDKPERTDVEIKID